MADTILSIETSVWNYLKSKGLPEKSVASVMGNIEAESSFDPTEVESGNSIGFGLCQWSFGRRTQLESYGTDLAHQEDFLWSELTGQNLSTTHADYQWIDKSPYLTNVQFMAGTGSIDDLTTAFCFCWERPNESEAHLDRRIASANGFFTQFTGTGGGTTNDNAPKIENAVQWMINIANDNTHGYDQTNRWSPDYDCSSFVISGYEQAGVPLKTNGATYTGDMKNVALATGFAVVDWGNDQTKLLRGDILLNEADHVCVYIGNGQIVQASENELGHATGGQTGDQTGTEIEVRSYYVFSSGWDCVLRLGSGTITPPPPPTDGDFYTKLLTTSYNVKQLSATQVTFLKTVSMNGSVKMIFTFNHNKKQIGTNYTGNRLTFDTKTYIIKDVKKNGDVVLSNSENVCYNYINPKYIKANN